MRLIVCEVPLQDAALNEENNVAVAIGVSISLCLSLSISLPLALSLSLSVSQSLSVSLTLRSSATGKVSKHCEGERR